MKFESETHPQDDHVDRITYCSPRYGQAPAVCTRVRLAKGGCKLCNLSKIMPAIQPTTTWGIDGSVREGYTHNIRWEAEADGDLWY